MPSSAWLREMPGGYRRNEQDEQGCAAYERRGEMKERPIIFSTDDVKAILSGCKKQTRRIIKPRPELGKAWKDWIIDPDNMDIPIAYCPYGVSGDQMWVREKYNWVTLTENDPWENLFSHIKNVPLDYKHEQAGCRVGMIYSTDEYWEGRSSWIPSIHMPRWASRINLEITNIRVERLNEISDQGSSNPWVWVIDFKEK